MKCYLYCEDTLEYWSKESLVKKHCKSQHDVFMFNPESGTACTEGQLSYCMAPAYGTFSPKIDDSDDPTSVFHDAALLEELDEEIWSSISSEVKYYHARRIDALPHFNENEIPDELPKAFVIVDDVDHEDVEDIEEFLDDIRGNPSI